ncbi:GGDEF domain-containing protein [Clostridium aminobutyricum]|uniref:GGDEF domain-containing protein n=1 Tax=Clostridium aminobutyricum TaxID=33953 RepID=A0A939DAA8_CLOAM|nr:GGDEF domain-containing protein [Clostridium aminobutyricum]MBN7774122.1 GGDEF domain-containing protein [Clostridium aminobutyricum]
MKKLNVISIIFILSIIMMTAFVFIALKSVPADTGYFNNEPATDFSDNWRISVDGEMISPVKLPANLKLTAHATVRLEKLIPTIMNTNTAICFRSSQQQVKVFVADQLIYSYGYEKTPPFSSSPGSLWNIIRLNPSDAGKTIAIELSSPFNAFSGSISPITIGAKSALLFHVWSQYSTTLISGVLLIFVGLLMLVVIAFCRIFLHIPAIIQPSSFLAIFSIITGVWIAIESRLLQFLFDDVYIAHYLDFITLAAAPAALQLYLLHVKGYKESTFLKILFIAGFTNVWLVFALHFLNIVDFMSTMVLSHAILVASAVYIITAELKSLIIEGHPHASKATTLALGVLILGFLLDFFRFYTNPTYAVAKFVGMGFVGFMIILMLESFLEFILLKNEADRTQLFKELAYLDSLTQLGNRTAYEEILETYQRNLDGIQKIAIFIADINGLKSINDTFGHSVGDIAISQSGAAIRDVFGRWGKAYRIGGDEFCMICENLTNEKCESLCLALKKEMETAKIGSYGSRQIAVQLSLGYAFYDHSETRIFSIQELVKRADNAMYSHKSDKSNRSIPKLQRDTIEMKRIEL